MHVSPTDGSRIDRHPGAALRKLFVHLPLFQALTFTVEPEVCPLLTRKLVRSERALLVSPEFSAVFS
jgi:hypothetical protein